jgi:membrane protease subunit HflK
MKSVSDRVGQMLRGSGGRNLGGPAVAILVSLVVLGWLSTGLYIVQPSEEGVVTFFGAYARTVESGLHYHLPLPIENAEIVQVTTQNKTPVGGAPGAPSPDESLMLTGDENIVDLSFTVQWHVSNARQYLFNVRNPDDAVKAVAESAMREVVGHSALQTILTTGRGDVQSQTAALMQQILDRYHAGVSIDAVQIQNANPPQDVVPAYQDIAKAGQDAQTAINDANTYRNRVVNEAKGDASKIVQAAQGYREQVVREAKGQAARFDQLYAQYRRAPALTRQRLYIETMQQVLSHNRKIIVDAKGASAPIILPPDAFRAVAPTEAGQPSSVQTPPAQAQTQAPAQTQQDATSR